MIIDPTTLKYTPTHEWVSLDGDVATIGISKFAVEQLTDLIMIDLPKVGSKVTTGKGFGEIESVKAVSDLYAPVGGEVVAVNADVMSDVQILAEDPYSKGWLIKVKVDDTSGLDRMLDYQTYQTQIVDQAH
jgi:glycine cleavage system H protein